MRYLIILAVLLGTACYTCEETSEHGWQYKECCQFCSPDFYGTPREFSYYFRQPSIYGGTCVCPKDGRNIYLQLPPASGAEK